MVNCLLCKTFNRTFSHYLNVNKSLRVLQLLNMRVTFCLWRTSTFVLNKERGFNIV
jgi:hypothetical protein